MCISYPVKYGISPYLKINVVFIQNRTICPVDFFLFFFCNDGAFGSEWKVLGKWELYALFYLIEHGYPSSKQKFCACEEQHLVSALP